MMKSALRLAFLGCALIALPVHGQDVSTPVALNRAVPSAGAAAPSMVLRPGDIVRIRIWREPDLSGDFAVDEQGIVVFPKIGARNVGNLAPEALKEGLVRDYQVYLRNPSIDVTMLRRVNVLGAVRSPGLYPVDPTMSFADVIAAAGGVTPQGKTTEAELIRDGLTVKRRITAEARALETLQSGDQIFVPERSWASRNSGVIAAAITASVSLLIALVR